MAQETTMEAKHQHHEHDDQNLWTGGQEPFKASYGKLMMWYFLLSDAFTFAGFLISYGALRFSMNTWPVPDFVFKTTPGGLENAPLIFVTFMTFVLIVSSVTMLRAVQMGKHENRLGVVKWMVLTIIGGATFLGCQAWEWNNLIATEGMTVFTNPFSAHTEKGKYLSLDELKAHAAKKGWVEKTQKVDDHGKEVILTYYVDAETGTQYFEKRDHHGHLPKTMDFNPSTPYLVTYDHNSGMYKPGAYLTQVDGKDVVKSESFGPKAFGALFFFITGFHGFHVLSGLIILLVIAINSWSGFYVERRNGYEMVEKVGLYWHFVDLVWVFVFLVFYLI
jgi:cytochrome c oxidase subunit 3